MHDLIPFGNNLEKIAEMTWEQFIDRTNELGNKLIKLYNDSNVERREYFREVCRGGFNFGKSVGWVVDYAPHPKALERVASALEAIVNWPNAGSMAWEMRRFIKASEFRGYNNVPSVVEFADHLRKMGTEDPANMKGIQIDMDFVYWDSSGGIDGESSDNEILEAHMINIRRAVKGMERLAYPDIIDCEPRPTKEQLKAEKKALKKQYSKDFISDAKSNYRAKSVFEHLTREELFKRPYHRIVTFPSKLMEIAEGQWVNEVLSNASETLTLFYKKHHYMVEERQNPNTWPSSYQIGTHFDGKFEKRLQRTLNEKPWLIDFSVKYMDLFKKSFVGGNHGTNHAGEIEMVYKNPGYDPKSARLFNDEYSHRTLEADEEKMFIQSIVDIKSLEIVRPKVIPPKQSWVFNGQYGTPYEITLNDGRQFNLFLKKEYGSTYCEGKMVIVTNSGQEPLFKQ